MIYTFYSYKGGVGRTMALANVGEVFYRAGLKVLLVDWDLEAPGLERFFVDAERTTAQPGVIDMLLEYKHQMTQDWTAEAGHLPFKKPSDIAFDLYPDSPKGRLQLLTAGQRDKVNFSHYANAVLTFDWKDFYDNWEGEAYFEWLRQQFLAMADVVLIDSRTGITEMGGVCTYQLADVVVAFCTANQQSLSGTAEVLSDLMKDDVREARQRPLKVVAVPARVEQSDRELLSRFKKDFLALYSPVAADTLKITPDQLWELGIPYIPSYAYEETCPVRESEAIAREISRAFKLLTLVISRLAKEDSKVYSAFPVIRTEQADVVGAVVVGEQIFIGESISFVEGPDPDVDLVADYEAALYLLKQDAYYQAYQRLIKLRKQVQGSLITSVDQALRQTQRELAVGTEQRIVEARRVTQEKPRNWEAQAAAWRRVVEFNPESAEARESLDRMNIHVWQAVEAEMSEILDRVEYATQRLDLREMDDYLVRAKDLGLRTDLPEGLLQEIHHLVERIQIRRREIRNQLGIASTTMSRGDLRTSYSQIQEYVERGVPVAIDESGVAVPTNELLKRITEEYVRFVCDKVDKQLYTAHDLKRNDPERAMACLAQARSSLVDDARLLNYHPRLHAQLEEVEREMDDVDRLLRRFEQAQSMVKQAHTTSISAQEKLSLLLEAREIYPDYPSISEYIDQAQENRAAELTRLVEDVIVQSQQLTLQRQFTEALATLHQARADALRIIPEPKPNSLLAQALGRVNEQETAVLKAQASERDSADYQRSYKPLPPPPLDTLPEPGPLPPGSRLPFARNAIFTGREEALKVLARGLLGEGRAALVTQAIQGMGGVGKTQLAVELAWRYGRFFRGVHWVSAAQPEQIAAEIAACGERMGLRPWPVDLPDQVEQTLAAWRTHGPRLVVVDNLEDVSAAREWWPRLHEAGVRLVVTARRRAWPRDLGLRPLHLKVFEPDESRAFLRAYITIEQAGDEDLNALAERLGYLPMALELAGRYLEKHPWLTVEGYLERLENAMTHSSMVAQLSKGESATGHGLDLAGMIALSWERVVEDGARRVFLVAAWCAPNVAIPCELLARAAGLNDEGCGEALAGLVGLGLLEGEVAGPTIHPLVAEYGRAIQAEGDSDGFEPLKVMARELAKLATETNETGLPARFVPLRAHVRAVAVAAEAAGLEAAGGLWNDLGSHLRDAAEYPGARAAFERAIVIYEATFGPDHPSVAICVNNLGMVLQDLGDLAGARAAFERALGIDEAAFGPEHPNIATGVNNLGMVLWALGDLAGARAAFERALVIDEAAFGPEHPTVAIRVNNLGMVLKDLGDLLGAREALERTLLIDEQAYGPAHPSVAAAVSNLGGMLQAMGDLAAAKAAYERALRINEQAFGPDHPIVARDVNNLGSVLQDLGDLAGARAAYEQALAIFEHALGPEHPNAANVLNNLGSVLKTLGDMAGARSVFEQALAVDQRIYPPDHPRIARDASNVGTVLHELGDLAGARAAFEQTLRIDEKTFGPTHLNVAYDFALLGDVLRDQGDRASARNAYEQALSIFQSVLPPEHSHLGTIQKNLEQLLLAERAQEKDGSAPQVAEEISISELQNLLAETFTAEELRRFCIDHPLFRPVANRFGPKYNLVEMIDTIIDYCERLLLWNELLTEVARANPRQYARFEPVLRVSVRDS